MATTAQRNQPSRRDLTQGSLNRHVLRLTGPMIIGLLAIFAVDLADAFWVARLGTLELAA
ncbi:MAG TPA: MATE family efflux transporter, partial [Gammaproteobacteria bacterium]|nr:MATE family efflux transporter [Gammaproteobacteria bacterium]